ncbi:MAG: hypothetical protein ACLFR7_09185 [Opitutales bacterium]
MSAKRLWIAALLALFLSLGVVGGMAFMHLDAIVAAARPPETKEERLDPATPLYWDRYFTELHELEKELIERSAELDEREGALEKLEKELAARTASLDKRATELVAAREEIREWFVLYDDDAQANYQRVAKTYAAMDPEKVVPILLATPVEEVAKTLLEMKPEVVAPIWTAILDASQATEANALRVSKLIDLMGRIRSGAALTPKVEIALPESARAEADDKDEAAAAAEPERFTDDEVAYFKEVAKTYELMEPDRVASVLLQTPPRNAAGVLMQMRPENVAAIWSSIIDASRQEEGATEKVVAMAEVMRNNRNGDGRGA